MNFTGPNQGAAPAGEEAGKSKDSRAQRAEGRPQRSLSLWLRQEI